MSDFLRTWVENSQGDDAIKEETLKILDEAKVIRESVWDEDAQREYEEVRLSTIWALTNLRHETRDDLESIRAELWEWWSIDVFKYAEGDITQSELWNISKEFEDLQRTSIESVQESKNETNAPSEINENLLKTIETTNSEIIAGWEPRFSEEIDLFISRYWKLSLIQQISDADYEVIESNLNALKNWSWNIYTKLLKLTQVVYKANDKIGAIGKTMISAWYGSNFIETHNHATQDIVKRVIDNSDNIFAVWYNKDDGWYYVNEWEIDKNNDMEVGTYLCSLNKSQKLNKENLLQEYWGPFSPTELFMVLDKYKSWTFGWSEVQGLFSWYLQDFENNMELIAIDYLANEQSGSHIIDFFNAKYESENKDSFSLLWVNDIESVVDRTMWEDISSIQDMDLLDEITRIRVERTSELFVSQLAELYWNNQDIMDLLRAMSIVSLEWNNSGFDYSWLNQMISEHNESFGTEYPVIQWDLLTMIEGAFSSFNTSQHLAQDLEAKIQELDRVKNSAQATIDRITVLRQELDSENNEDRIRNIQSEIHALQMRNFRLLQDVSETENEVSDAEEDLDDSIDEAVDLITDLSLLIEAAQAKLDENHDNTQEVFQELIPADATPEERQAFLDALNIYFHKYSFEEILNNPRIRLSKITDKGILISLLTQYNSDRRLIDTNFKDLPASLRNDKEVALAFPWKINEKDFPYMYSNLLKQDSFVRSVIIKSINRWDEGVWATEGNLGLLLQRFCAAWWDTRKMVEVLSNIFNSYPDFKDKISEYIPYSILQSDNNWLLWIDIQNIEISIEEAITQLSTLWETYWEKEELSRNRLFNKVDLLLEQNPGNDELKLLLIEKWGLPYTQYLKGNLWLDKSSLIWEHILKHDIYSIKYLEEGTRKNSYFQKRFIESLPDYTVSETNWEIRLWYLLEYIPLESPQEIYTFTHLLKDRFPEQFLWEDGNLNSQVYIFIWSNERFRNIITSYFESNWTEGLDDVTSKFVSTCIFSSAGLIWQTRDAFTAFQDKNNTIWESYGDSFKNLLLHHDSFENLFSGTAWEEKLNNVMSILTWSSITRITESDGIKLAEIFGDNLPEFIQICKDNEIEAIDRDRRNFWNTAIDKNLYPNDFHDFFTLNENWEYTPHLDNIDTILVPEIIAQLRISGITWEDKQEQIDFTIAYLQTTYNLSSEQAYQWENILNRSITKVILEATDSTDYAEAMAAGKWIEYIQTIQREIWNDAVLKIYPNASIDKDWNISIPSQSQQNLNTSEMWLDTRDTYREISSELMLSPEEQSSLTTEELNAIASSETVRESFIWFRSTLVELWLTELWKFRGDIFKAIWSLDFSVADGDYIGENEFNIFLAETVYATTGGKRLKPTPSNLESTKQIIREVNHQTWGPNDVDSVNTVGEAMTLVENNFREKFAPKNSGIMSFNIWAFQKARRE